MSKETDQYAKTDLSGEADLERPGGRLNIQLFSNPEVGAAGTEKEGRNFSELIKAVQRSMRRRG